MTTPSDDTGRTRSRRRPERRVTPSASGGYPPDEFDVDYEPGQRRGAHRTATPAVLEQLPWLVVALVAVIAVVAAIVLLTGGDDPEAGAPSPSSSAPATEPASTDPAATTPATTEPPATTTEPPATTSAPAPTPDRSLELVVLNGTSTSGLGADVGDELTELGWTVGTVGNAPDKPVAATVVLWSSPEHQVTAEAVAAELDATAEQSDAADGAVVVVVGTDRA